MARSSSAEQPRRKHLRSQSSGKRERRRAGQREGGSSREGGRELKGEREGGREGGRAGRGRDRSLVILPSPTETSLAGYSIQEESAIPNGLGGISVCSSRSRAHRNSGTYGKGNRKSSQDELSPKHRRSGVVDVGMSSKDSKESLVDDSIMLDPASILDEIMAKPFEDSEDERQPQGKGGQSRMSNGTSSSRPVFTVGKESAEPSRPRQDLGSRGRDREEQSREGDRRAGHGKSAAHTGSGQAEEPVAMRTSRLRSDAMDSHSSPILKSKAKMVSQRTLQEEEEGKGALPKTRSMERKQELRRSGSIQSEEQKKLAGSWNQIPGGKALGMFYHNRRSQFLDQEALDELMHLEKSPTVERQDASLGSPGQPRESPLIKVSTAAEPSAGTETASSVSAATTSAGSGAAAENDTEVCSHLLPLLPPPPPLPLCQPPPSTCCRVSCPPSSRPSRRSRAVPVWLRRRRRCTP